MVRIAYGVHGYGKGHATRSEAMIRTLSKHHEILVFAGAQAYEHLSGLCPIVRVDSIGYAYSNSGKASVVKTVAASAPVLYDYFFKGKNWKTVSQAFDDFQPDVVISDAEIWTHGVAEIRGIPRISFDHFGAMVWCKPEMSVVDQIKRRIHGSIYKVLFGTPQRKLVSSFFDVNVVDNSVLVVPPILRPEVLEIEPKDSGHLLVYLNNGKEQWSDDVCRVLKNTNLPLKVYGTGRIGDDENIEFCQPSNTGFLRDLASCRAVISTAGNQLVGEAMYYKKAMLVMPESCVEQRMNARALEKLGGGTATSFEKLSSEKIVRFVENSSEFDIVTQSLYSDGYEMSVNILTGWIDELTNVHQTVHSVRKQAA